MNKRVLMVATVPSMIGQFNMDNISILLDMGYYVDVASNFNDSSIWPPERVNIFRSQMEKMGIGCFQIDFSRSPFRFGNHRKAYKGLLKLLNTRNYSFVHTHTPIASAILRIAAHQTNTSVIYTAHGFHFYKGAPLLNWIVFYPLEKWLSKYTDTLVTINKEDFERAQKRFNAGKVIYLPGIGVDLDKFTKDVYEREKIRKEFGIKSDDFLLLSVGELNDNKNHLAVIKAVAGLNVHYAVVGKGEKKDELIAAASKYKVHLILTGYRNDVASIYSAADLYILPSIREGLNVSLMEAMSCGLPVACSKIRGNVDLIDDGVGGYLFNPKSINDIRLKIETLINCSIKFGEYNRNKIKNFGRNIIIQRTKELYQTIQTRNKKQ